MGKRLFVNNWRALLVGPIDSLAVTLTVDPTTAAALTGLTDGDYYLLTLVKLDTLGREIAWEIIKVTGQSGGTLSIIRGQESTAAAAWSGDTLIEARLTAGDMSALREAAAAGPAGVEDTAADGMLHRRRFGEWVAEARFELLVGEWTDACPVIMSTSSAIVMPANTVLATPFIPKQDMTVDQLGINVTTAAAGSVMLILYKAASNGWPDTNLPSALGVGSTASTGHVAVTLNQPAVLEAGRLYWVLTHVSAGVTLRAAANGLPVLGTSADGTSRYSAIKRSVPYLSGAPSPWAFTRTDLVTDLPPLVRLRRSA